MTQFELAVAAAMQRIIREDVSQAKSILASLPSDIREKVVWHFRNSENLRNLFPEYVDAVTNDPKI